MAWVKLDDGFFRHDKARAAGKDGRALFVASLAYAASRRSDGFIADTHLGVVAAEAEVRPTVAKMLVQVGLWEVVDGGYRVHDYLDYQPSAEQVDELRQKRAAAGARGGKQAATSKAKAQASATAKSKQEPKQEPKQAASKPATPYPVPSASTKPQPPAVASPTAGDAQRLVSAFWEDSNPRPSVKFIALVKMTESFLEAGWLPEQISQGLRQTRAFTKDSIEYTLRQGLERMNGAIPTGRAGNQARLQAIADSLAENPRAIG